MFTLYITFKTYKPKNFRKLDIAFEKLKTNFPFSKQLEISEKISLKNRSKNFTVLRSPHVHKKSREHFQFKTQQRLFVIKSTKILPLLYINYLISNFLNIGLLVDSNIITR